MIIDKENMDIPVGAIVDLKNKWSGSSLEKPRAFIVLGLEGAGTYMIHNALVEAKCVPLAYEGDGQIIDNLRFDISIRQSFPHAGEWPDWCKLDYKCRRAGYKTIIIWIIREPHAQIQSVLRRDPERDIQELYKLQADFFGHGYCGQGEGLGGMDGYGSVAPDWLVITYSAFVHSEGFRKWLFEERLRLPYPEDFEVYDGNKKHYK